MYVLCAKPSMNFTREVHFMFATTIYVFDLVHEHFTLSKTFSKTIQFTPFIFLTLISLI